MTSSLAEVRRAAEGRSRASLRYRAAVLTAVAELEAEGAPDAFTRVAVAAGVSRQAVHELVTRARARAA